MKNLKFLAVAAITACAVLNASASQKLVGNVIGSSPSVDYVNGGATTTANTPQCAFDGNPDTFYASFDRSFTWVGLDMGEPYVIDRVGFMARNDGLGPGRTVLSVFQGANKEDFSDAIPFYIIEDAGKIGTMTYADVNCSRGFRYVRYVGSHDGRCNIAELEFYGTPGEGDDSHLFQLTNLPTLVVNTPGMEWFHEDDKEYEMNGSAIIIIADGTVDTDAPGQIRGRGNASWGFPKKPFRIKFDKKQQPLGGPAKAKKWAVINNYGDKTLMRNRLAFDISERLGMDFTPTCKFVDVVFNGEYQGCYQFCDQVEVNPKRVEITEMEKTDIEGEALTGGYLIEVDAYASQEDPGCWFESDNGYYIPVTIKSPDYGIMEQYSYISGRFNELCAAVRSYGFDDPETGYRRLLDLDTFLRHFIVGELSGNTDTYWSTYMTLDRGATQFRVGPVWDFDIAFENDNRTYPINNHNDFIYKYGSAAGDMRWFVQRITDDDQEARVQMRDIWSDARENRGLDYDTFSALIDGYAAELDHAQRLNFMRWPIMNEYVHQNPTIGGSYAAEVKRIKDYLAVRFLKLDKLIGRNLNSVPSITPTADSPAALYNLQGIYMGSNAQSLPAGIYIERRGDVSRKVVVR